MMECDGYKMFTGKVRITPAMRADGTRWREPFDMEGVWLYKPDTECWYCKPANGGIVNSFPAGVLSDFRETHVG